ncbi:MAG TPA: M28 family peptidase [bacterium]|nr:M28 family peptidase [bacterium]
MRRVYHHPARGHPGRAQAVILLLATAAAAAGLGLLPRMALPYAGPRAWAGPLAFDGARAWRDLRALATAFPHRWSGGPDRAAAADWLARELEAMALEVHRDRFDAWVGGPRPTTLENIWAVSPGAGRPDEIIVLVGNYDMAPTSVQAASDTAGHVATILELARVLTARPHRRTLLFLFPDGEEWGMLGARRFVRTFPRRAQIVAALSIEDLDPGPLRELGIDGTGQFRGFAPMWLRALAADAAAREGYPAGERGPLVEWVQRSLLISSTDQGPFLERGIAAIDLAGWTDDAALKDRVYHLPDDTIEHMRTASLRAYGRIQERIVRALDAMPEGLREPSVYLLLAPDRVVPAGPLLAVQLLVFAPLAAALALRLGGAVTLRAAALEWLALAVVLAVLLLWVDVVKALPLVGLLPRFALYAPPPRHPLLTTVLWPALLLPLAVLAAAASAVRSLLRSLRGSSQQTEGRIAALLAAQALLSAVAVAYNPFAAVTFLLVPAWLWIWIRPRRHGPGRLLNGLLVAAGFLVVVVLFAQYAAMLRVGPYILWYVYLAIAYGQFTLTQITLALATVAVAARLLAVAALPATGP